MARVSDFSRGVAFGSRRRLRASGDCRAGSRSGSCSALDKAVLWRKRFRRFRHSGQTVMEFCAAEGVSTASFYQWRRRLGKPRSPRHRAASRFAASSHRATGAGRAASARRSAPSRSGPSAARPNESRLPDVGRLSCRNVAAARGEVDRTPDFQAVRVTAGLAPISVHLPGGVRIEGPPKQLHAVRAVVEALCRWRRTADGEDGSC